MATFASKFILPTLPRALLLFLCLPNRTTCWRLIKTETLLLSTPHEQLTKRTFAKERLRNKKRFQESLRFGSTRITYFPVCLRHQFRSEHRTRGILDSCLLRQTRMRRVFRQQRTTAYVCWSQVLHGYLFFVGLDLQSQNLTSFIFERFRTLLRVLCIFPCRGVPLHAIVSDFTSNLSENYCCVSRFIRDLLL